MIIGTGYDSKTQHRNLDELGVTVGDRGDFANTHAQNAEATILGVLQSLQEVRRTNRVPEFVVGDAGATTAWNAAVDVAIADLQTALVGVRDANEVTRATRALLQA